MDKAALVLARRYAQAYLDLFIDTVTPENYLGFSKAADLLQSNTQISFLFDLAVVGKDVKLTYMRSVITKCNLPASVEKLIDLVVDHKRGSLFAEIFTQIVLLYKQRAKLDVCVVRSAQTLTQEEKISIEKAMQKKINQTKLDFVFSTDPALIAGICCQTTTLRWEQSVDQKIRRLEQLLKR